MTLSAIGRLILLAWLCAVATACGQAATTDPTGSAPATHTVVIEGVTFQPATLRVTVGDVIVWANKDPFPHTVTSAAAHLESGDIAPGASWTWTAATTGAVPYICRYHPTMTGTVEVGRR